MQGGGGGGREGDRYHNVRAIMAAGSIRLLLFYLILAFLPNGFRLYVAGKISKVNTFMTGCGLRLDGSELFYNSDELCFKVVKFKSIMFTSRVGVRREGSVWMKHGILLLQTPDFDFPKELTICVDVESNPGDIELTQDSSSSSTRSSNALFRIVYGRMELRSLRKLASSYIAPDVFNRLKSLQILRKRGSRGGCRRFGSSFQSIRLLGNFGGQRESINYSSSRHVNPANLIQINTSPPNSLDARHLKVCVWNAQSLRNKTASLVDYIHDNKLDILAISETWFSDKDAAVKAECTPDGYKLYDVHRYGRNGGGTALITRSNIIVKQVVAPTWCSFELSEWILIDGSFRLRLAVVYRPPYSTKHPVTISSFVSEFSQYLESFVLCTEPILLCGDFNIDVDVEDKPDAESFVDLIDSFGLAQHVHFATHVEGHILDLVITRKMDSIIQSFTAHRWLS